MPANSPNLSALSRNAERIRELRGRIDAGFRGRATDNGLSWKAALVAFRAAYDELAFPGGISSAYSRVGSGDIVAIEHALEFVEAHPYFFRSQYARAKFVRLLKRAPLSPDQAERLRVALELDSARRKTKRNLVPNHSSDPTHESVTVAAVQPPRHP